MPHPFLPEARLMRALSHPGRLAILAGLRDEPACVCHLTTLLRRPQAYVSQQLAILRDAGLIDAERDGGFTYYRVREQGVLRLIEHAGRVTGGSKSGEPTMPGRRAQCSCPRCMGALSAQRAKSA